MGAMVKSKATYLHFPDGTKAEIKPVMVEAPQSEPIQTTLDDLIIALQGLKELVRGGVMVNFTYSLVEDSNEQT